MTNEKPEKNYSDKRIVVLKTLTLLKTGLYDEKRLIEILLVDKMQIKLQ